MVILVDPRQLVAKPLFLNALVALNRSMEIRTTVYSKKHLDLLLSKHPAAITFSPSGVLDAARLLGGYLEHDDLFRPITRSTRVRNWRCYAQGPGVWQFEFKELLDSRAVAKKAAALVKQISQAGLSICAFVPDMDWTSEHDEKICTILSDVMVHSLSGGKPVALDLKGLPESATVPEGAQEAAHDEGTSNREALIRVRREMLEKVGSFSSEDLATAAQSTTTNPSQLAADERSTGKLFGVRFGREWRYPKFQFDAKRHTLPEMKSVLSALSPDDQGWDRLQWFLEPHEVLKGHTPIDIWKRDRQKVVDAANTERWDGRD